MRREDGFTIIEVLVAALILTLGSLAVFTIFAAAVHNVQRGREQQIDVSVAQREMEKLRVLEYDELGLTSTPAHSSNEKSPDFRIAQGTGKLNLERKSSAPPILRDIVSGSISPTPQQVRAEDGSEATVYRFVACEEDIASPGDTCNAKRIVIDVLPVPKAGLDQFQHSYYELQSTVVNPEPEATAE